MSLTQEERHAIEHVAKAIYSRRFPKAPLDEHFAWYHAGKGNPSSCVHYSTVAEAFKDARAAIEVMGELKHLAWCAGRDAAAEEAASNYSAYPWEMEKRIRALRSPYDPQS